LRSFLLLIWVPALMAQIVPRHYIVELTGEPAMSAAATTSKDRRTAATENRRAALRAEQSSIRQRLATLQADVLDSVENVGNALIVRLPDDDITALQAMPGVRRVHAVYEVQPLLDRALPLHHVPEAWDRIGGIDRAGAGARIAILDSGIDQTHPALQDSSMTAPEGFPRANREVDLDFANSKVIVARSYAYLYGAGGDQTPRDRQGHGTAVSTTAAGVLHQTPQGWLSGVAPKAWLGNYNLSNPGSSTSFRNDVITKAFDDAVADGMDVINMSLGSVFARRPEDDIFTDMVNRAADLGVLVVVSAGNEGPEPSTIGSKAVPASAIGVGASVNDRIFSGTATLSQTRFRALPGNGLNLPRPVTASLFDVERIDPSGLACSPLPLDSLQGRIAFILRGTCTFEIKLNNAAAAGATAALLYSHSLSPDAVTMSVGSARLPASMVSHTDGLKIKQSLSEEPEPEVTVNFVREPFFVSPNNLADFSSRGPNTDLSIKPDLIATGTSVFTASPGSSYTTVQGTSFSAPLVSGAAAVVKAARPGLTAAQYRSLLINTATPFLLDSGEPAGVQQAGSGALNLEAAVRSTVTAFPTSLSFGAAGSTATLTRSLTISSLSPEPDTFSVTALPFGGGTAPAVLTTEFSGGALPRVQVQFPTGLAPGEYQGFLRIQGQRSDSEIRVPYWFAVPSGIPAAIKVLESSTGAAPGAFVRAAISLRITDGAGVPLILEPRVTVISGGGDVSRIVSRDFVYPGVFEVDLRLGTAPGQNVFRIEAGDVRRDVTIEGR